MDVNTPLTQIEQAQLSAYVSTDGFKLIDRIMRSEVDKFNVALLNSNKPEDVIQNHNLAKAAAMFYQGVIDKINFEIYSYTHTPRPEDVPVDMTEGILDLQNMEE